MLHRVVIVPICCMMLMTGCEGCKNSGNPAVQRKTDLHGMSIQQAIANLGQPDQQYSFTMDQVSGEFRVELYNTYPPGAANNANVTIKEYWWKQGDYVLTLWFHLVNNQWVVLDACRWHKDVQF